MREVHRARPTRQLPMRMPHERGGPPVRAPTRQGFGSQLIERSLSAENGGRASIDYASEGVICQMETPLRRQAAPVETAPAD